MDVAQTSQRCESCADYDEPRIAERANRALEIRAARRIEQRQAVDDRPPTVLMREVQQVLRVDCDHNNFFYEPHHSFRAREIIGL